MQCLRCNVLLNEIAKAGGFVEEAEKWAADAMFVGTKDIHGLHHLLHGSVSSLCRGIAVGWRERFATDSSSGNVERDDGVETGAARMRIGRVGRAWGRKTESMTVHGGRTYA